MRIRERRLTVALVAACGALGGLAVARADDDKVPSDWKCNVRKVLAADSDRNVKQGEAHAESEDESETRTMRELDEAGTELSSDVEETKIHFERLRALVNEDAAAKTSEAQLRYVAWSRKSKDGTEDRSLEGKVVVVRHAGERRSFFIVTPQGARAKVSDEALAWVKKEHGTKGISKESTKKLNLLVPEKPTAPEGEWTSDASILGEALLDEDMRVDVEHSTVKGKLTNVRKDAGAIVGVVTLDMSVQLERVPTTDIEWAEGGRMEMKVEHEGLLDDPTAPRADDKMSMHLKGKIKVASSSGARIRQVEVTVATARKLRAAKAPQLVTLKFDPESEYRFALKAWASGGDAKSRVGDRSFFEVETTTTSKVKIDGKKTVDTKVTLSARAEVEVTSVVDKKEAEWRVTVTRWRSTAGDETDDSLEGKVVVLSPGKPGYKVTDAKGKKVKPDDAAKKFIESELARARSRSLQLDNLHELLGEDSVEPEKEIGIDCAKAVTKIFGAGQQIDEEGSKASAKLTGVHLVSGDHEGKLEGRVLLKLKTIPGAKGGRFEDPATCDLRFRFEGALEGGAADHGTSVVTMDYFGVGAVNGKVFEPKVTTERTIRVGVLPRAAEKDEKKAE